MNNLSLSTNRWPHASVKAYSNLKTLTKTSKPKASVITDADGNIPTENAAVLNWWTEYCTDSTTRFNQTMAYFITIPDQDRTTKVRPYLRQMLRRQCVVLRQENLREEITSLPS
ncbi:hypothetical protein DPMN_054447 [Dreissena polymorpha]|uniref:Uncharacterized protein n=1 Tax=Dreissena polymorpha TaxID=45954 RepID=A0A9D4CN55_DREPO|nr:hypothetical protein DPMN_054447 [Dreissena polymorpha]